MSERFGNYEIIRRLAAGGMAEVLLAKQRSFGGFERLVCLKRILPHLGHQEDFLKMFQDEARIAANLMHPNIAQIYDIAVEEERYFIAMEYIRGEDLRRVYNQEVAHGNTMALNIAAQVAMGAAAGLDYAHRQQDLKGQALNIVHRDISPQNIVVSYDGFVKLIDFGVAKAAGKLIQTRSGVLKGKYSYMSPEQASGDAVDGRTDIFALGITLYEITTGVRLFKRDNELETLHAVIACNIVPPHAIVPHYARDFEAIVLKALAYEPEQRYSTAGELERALEHYLLAHNYPVSASNLAHFMSNLFADKLADEALFGGPPWQEAATHSSNRGAKRLEQPAATQPPAAQDWQLLAQGKEDLEQTISNPRQRLPEAQQRAFINLSPQRQRALPNQAAQRASGDDPPTDAEPLHPLVASAPPQKAPAKLAKSFWPLSLALLGGVTLLSLVYWRRAQLLLRRPPVASHAPLIPTPKPSAEMPRSGKPHGTLAAQAKPWAWIKLGKEPATETPANFDLEVGHYHVTFECPNGHRESRQVHIRPAETTEVRINCL